jgi:cytochrome oxidase assembly protein ShyY1
MPAIIDSAPDCITHVSGAKPADDSADFILQAAYAKCQGIMTFGPGTTFGDDGSKAATAYYVLTWIGIAVMVAVIVAWVLYEDRRLWRHVARIQGRTRGGPAAGVTEPPVTD